MRADADAHISPAPAFVAPMSPQQAKHNAPSSSKQAEFNAIHAEVVDADSIPGYDPMLVVPPSNAASSAAAAAQSVLPLVVVAPPETPHTHAPTPLVVPAPLPMLEEKHIEDNSGNPYIIMHSLKNEYIVTHTESRLFRVL